MGGVIPHDYGQCPVSNDRSDLHRYRRPPRSADCLKSGSSGECPAVQEQHRNIVRIRLGDAPARLGVGRGHGVQARESSRLGVCHNDGRASMKGESPEQQWNRVQRHYQQAVEASYPNPERRGCPGMDALRGLATRSTRFEDLEEDSQWKHVIRCGPCYLEFLDLRDASRLGGEAKVHHEST